MPSSPHFKIRAATLLDAQIVVDFIRELAEFEQLTDQVKVTAELLRQNLFGPDATAEACLVEADGRPVGFALFFTSFSTFLGRSGLYLEDLYVQPAWRSHGLGKRLLQHLARLTMDRHCGRLEWSVLKWNPRAITFYENLGAEAMSGWQTYRLSGEALESLARAPH